LLSKEENISKEKREFEKKVGLKCFIYKEIVSEERKKCIRRFLSIVLILLQKLLRLLEPG
jgi:hypothetical protein